MIKLDDENTRILSELVEKSMEKAAKDEEGQLLKQYIFIPTKRWRSNFGKRWGFMYCKQYDREVNLNKLLSNLEPALLYVYVMRRICDINGGEAKIWNGDQSMWYRLYQANKHWVERDRYVDITV